MPPGEEKLTVPFGMGKPVEGWRVRKALGLSHPGGLSLHASFIRRSEGLAPLTYGGICGVTGRDYFQWEEWCVEGLGQGCPGGRPSRRQSPAFPLGSQASLTSLPWVFSGFL